MTSLQPARPARISWSSGSRPGLGAVVFLASLAFFAGDLHDPPFVDEYAYISQSYYADLFLDGETNDGAWLEMPAYDLTPLPKYLIGVSLRVAGYGRPGEAAARMWYRNTHNVFGPAGLLTAARAPSVLLGAVGCVAIFALGVLTRDARVGVVAAFLLAINPLYRLHAHRAMSEVSCETFLYLSLAIAAWCWARSFGPRAAANPWLVLGLIGAGAAAGLSVLAKFNGLLALMTLAAWAVLGAALPGRSWRVKSGFAAGSCLAVAAAWVVFVGLNPFLTADPVDPLPAEAQRYADMGVWGRFRFLIEHRRAMSRGQQEAFPHNALTSPLERAEVVAVQGFGRFGPFGPASSESTRRFDPEQDAGALVWLPVCLAGLACSILLGRRQNDEGEAPLGWAMAAWALTSLVVVTSYLPMAWDRYQLPIQAPFCLLAAIFLMASLDAVVARVRPSRTEAVV